MRRLALNLRALLYAGIAAGIIVTLVQIGLWWAFQDSVLEMLYRDARLTAAMILGRAILPPPATFDGAVMLVATLIHFALSITYSAIIAVCVARGGLVQAIIVGGVCGLILFGVNMYGFTRFFPWFEQARDWITLAAHAAFGITAAVIYKQSAKYRAMRTFNNSAG